MRRNWKNLNDNVNSRSPSTHKKKELSKFSPCRQTKERQDCKIVSPLNKQSKSKRNSFQQQKQGHKAKHYSKDSNSFMKNSSSELRFSEIQESEKKNREGNDHETCKKKNEDLLKNSFSERVLKTPYLLSKEVEKVKKQFNKFQEMIRGELLRQERMIEVLMRQILQSFASESQKQAFEPERILESIKIRYPSQMNLQHKKPPLPHKKLTLSDAKDIDPFSPRNSNLSSHEDKDMKEKKMFGKFFSAMEKLKDDLVGLTEMASLPSLTPKADSFKLEGFKKRNNSQRQI